MKNFQRKMGLREIMQSKPVLILLGVVILVFAWSVLNFWNKMQETSKNKKIIEDKVALLKQQKEKLTADINSLNTEEGKEKIFRENFGLVKEGEGMIVVVDDKNSPLPIPPAPTGLSGFLKNLFK